MTLAVHLSQGVLKRSDITDLEPRSIEEKGDRTDVARPTI